MNSYTILQFKYRIDCLQAVGRACWQKRPCWVIRTSPGRRQKTTQKLQKSVRLCCTGNKSFKQKIFANHMFMPIYYMCIFQILLLRVWYSRVAKARAPLCAWI